MLWHKKLFKKACRHTLRFTVHRLIHGHYVRILTVVMDFCPSTACNEFIHFYLQCRVLQTHLIAEMGRAAFYPNGYATETATVQELRMRSIALVPFRPPAELASSRVPVTCVYTGVGDVTGMLTARMEVMSWTAQVQLLIMFYRCQNFIQYNKSLYIWRTCSKRLFL